MPTVLDVDPDVYASAGHTFLAVNDAVCDIVAVAANSADTAHGMAGVDSTGAAWAKAYDSAADALLRAGATVVDALGIVGDRLALSGSNHADAEDASTGRPGASPPAYSGQPGTTRAVSVVVSSPPTADGTPTDPPAGWSLVAHALAWVWPSGHPDRLVAVGNGWLTASLKLADEADRLAAPIADLSGQSSPEVPYALTMCTGLQTAMRTLADQSAVVAQACTGYANAITAMHHDIVEELANLLDQAAAVEVAGGLLAGPTFGVSEAGAQGVMASRIAVSVTRIFGFLTRLARETLTLENLVQGVTEQAVTVLTEMRRVTDAEQALQAATTLIEAGIPPVDLQANEDNNPTAHVIERHVDVTDEDLKMRGKRVASRFTSLAAATMAISTTLAVNQAAVTTWLAGSERDLDLFGPLPPGAGRAYLRDSDQFVPCPKFKMTLLRNAYGFYVVTAFPEP